MLCVAGMAPQERLEAAFRCAISLQLRQSAHNWQRFERAYLLEDSGCIGRIFWPQKAL